MWDRLEMPVILEVNGSGAPRRVSTARPPRARPAPRRRGGIRRRGDRGGRGRRRPRRRLDDDVDDEDDDLDDDDDEDDSTTKTSTRSTRSTSTTRTTIRRRRRPRRPRRRRGGGGGGRRDRVTAAPVRDASPPRARRRGPRGSRRRSLAGPATTSPEKSERVVGVGAGFRLLWKGWSDPCDPGTPGSTSDPPLGIGREGSVSPMAVAATPRRPLLRRARARDLDATPPRAEPARLRARLPRRRARPRPAQRRRPQGPRRQPRRQRASTTGPSRPTCNWSGSGATGRSPGTTSRAATPCSG